MNSMHNSFGGGGGGGYSGPYPGYMPPSALSYYNGYPAELAASQTPGAYYGKPAAAMAGYSTGMPGYSAPNINNSMYYQQYGLGYQYGYGKYGLGAGLTPSLSYGSELGGPASIAPSSLGGLQAPTTDLGLTGSMFSKGSSSASIGLGASGGSNKFSSIGSSSPHSSAASHANSVMNSAVTPTPPSPNPHSLPSSLRGHGATPSPPVDTGDGKKDLDKMRRCQLCGQVFRLMSECLAHMKAVHEAPMSMYGMPHPSHNSQSMVASHLTHSPARPSSLSTAPDSPLMALERMGWGKDQGLMPPLHTSPSPITHSQSYPSSASSQSHQAQSMSSHQMNMVPNPHLSEPRYGDPSQQSAKRLNDFYNSCSNNNSVNHEQSTSSLDHGHHTSSSSNSSHKSRKSSSYSVSSIIGESNDTRREQRVLMERGTSVDPPPPTNSPSLPPSLTPNLPVTSMPNLPPNLSPNLPAQLQPSHTQSHNISSHPPQLAPNIPQPINLNSSVQINQQPPTLSPSYSSHSHITPTESPSNVSSSSILYQAQNTPAKSESFRPEVSTNSSHSTGSLYNNSYAEQSQVPTDTARQNDIANQVSDTVNAHSSMLSDSEQTARQYQQHYHQQKEAQRYPHHAIQQPSEQEQKSSPEHINSPSTNSTVTYQSQESAVNYSQEQTFNEKQDKASPADYSTQTYEYKDQQQHQTDKIAESQQDSNDELPDESQTGENMETEQHSVRQPLEEKYSHANENVEQDEAPEQQLQNEVPEQQLQNEVPEQQLQNEVPEQQQVEHNDSQQQGQYEVSNTETTEQQTVLYSEDQAINHEISSDKSPNMIENPAETHAVESAQSLGVEFPQLTENVTTSSMAEEQSTSQQNDPLKQDMSSTSEPVYDTTEHHQTQQSMEQQATETDMKYSASPTQDFSVCNTKQDNTIQYDNVDQPTLPESSQEDQTEKSEPHQCDALEQQYSTPIYTEQETAHDQTMDTSSPPNDDQHDNKLQDSQEPEFQQNDPIYNEEREDHESGNARVEYEKKIVDEEAAEDSPANLSKQSSVAHSSEEVQQPSAEEEEIGDEDEPGDPTHALHDASVSPNSSGQQLSWSATSVQSQSISSPTPPPAADKHMQVESPQPSTPSPHHSQPQHQIEQHNSQQYYQKQMPLQSEYPDKTAVASKSQKSSQQTSPYRGSWPAGYSNSSNSSYQYHQYNAQSGPMINQSSMNSNSKIPGSAYSPHSRYPNQYPGPGYDSRRQMPNSYPSQGHWYPAAPGRGDTKPPWTAWGSSQPHGYPQPYFYGSNSASGPQHMAQQSVQHKYPPHQTSPHPPSTPKSKNAEPTAVSPVPVVPPRSSTPLTSTAQPAAQTRSTPPLSNPSQSTTPQSTPPPPLHTPTPAAETTKPEESEPTKTIPSKEESRNSTKSNRMTERQRTKRGRAGPKSKVERKQQLEADTTVAAQQNGSVNPIILTPPTPTSFESSESSDSDADEAPKLAMLKPPKRYKGPDGSFVGPKRVKIAKMVRLRQHTRRKLIQDQIKQSELEEQLTQQWVERAAEHEGPLANVLLKSSLILGESYAEEPEVMEECIATMTAQLAQLPPTPDNEQVKEKPQPSNGALIAGKRPGRKSTGNKVLHNDMSVVIKTKSKQKSLPKLRAKDFKWSHYIKSMRYWCKDCGHGFKNQKDSTMHDEEHCKWNCLYMIECYVSVTDIVQNKLYGNKVEELLEEYQVDDDHKCGRCGTIVSRKADYLVHVDTHKDFMPWECTICGTRFKIRGSLKEHLRYTHMKGRVPCLKCNKVFATSTLLRQHVKVHTQHYKYNRTGKHREQDLRVARETEDVDDDNTPSEHLSHEANEYRNWCKLMELNAMKNIATSVSADNGEPGAAADDDDAGARADDGSGEENTS
uniref:Serine/arginine repetitive matrix protein 2-like n=2 Tax=Hirondellea gigas TaxID=1518452 RepID=A0A6A7FUW5_9CRUS